MCVCVCEQVLCGYMCVACFVCVHGSSVCVRCVSACVCVRVSGFVPVEACVGMCVYVGMRELQCIFTLMYVCACVCVCVLVYW